MGNVQKSFESPDETREFDKGHVQMVALDSQKAGRAVLEPGWSWAGSVKPIVGGDSCKAHHVGYVVSGSLKVTPDDGGEFELKAGDIYEIQPGHNASVLGNENFVGLEFETTTAETYAKP